MPSNTPRLQSTPRITLATLLALLAACGGTTPSTAQDASLNTRGDLGATDTGPDDAGASPAVDVPAAPRDVQAADIVEPPVMSGSCDLLAAGMVTGFRVDDLQRSFILTLPPGATGPGGRWPVVFNWHGLGDSAPNMNMLLAGEVGEASFPFILVTPVSTGLGPTTAPIGLEWENLRATTPNREARLFDAVVRCLDTRWGVDRDRLYTVGFSAGAIMSDLLGVLRGSQIAAVASYSGGYFSNEENVATLGPLRTFPQWPEPGPGRYTQLMLFGGTRDTFNLFVATARFDVFAANDVTYLNERQHDVIYCDHEGGHTVPRAILGRQVMQFFAAHPRGAARSAWRSGLPTGWPSYCSFRGRTGG